MFCMAMPVGWTCHWAAAAPALQTSALKAQACVQVAWVAMETTLLLSTAYFQHASNMVSQNATQIVLQVGLA